MPSNITYKNGIYIASKAKYGSEWIHKRTLGYPIISSWIDQHNIGDTLDWPELWNRCITEASNSSALVLICRPTDILKGAWVEVGVALGNNIPVFATGISEYSIRHHIGINICQTEEEAFSRALYHYDMHVNSMNIN